MSRFPCTSCGACCRRVGKALQDVPERNNPDHPLYFPYQWDETGRCENLTDGNLCSVYESRPLICQVGALAPRLGILQQEWFDNTAKACNDLMDEDGLPEEMRITIPIVNS